MNYWLIYELLYIAYGITVLVLIVKKHQNHIEPVHLLAMSPLVNLILNFVNYFIYELASDMWSGPVFYKISLFFDNFFWYCFCLDVIVGDLNGFIFVRWALYYHDWITNKRAIIAIVFNKILVVVIVIIFVSISSLTYYLNSFCYLLFSTEAFLGCIPFFSCILIGTSVMCYIACRTYTLNQQLPQHNITYPQVPRVQNQIQNTIQNPKSNQPQKFVRSAWPDSRQLTSSSSSNNSRQIEENIQEIVCEIPNVSRQIEENVKEIIPPPQIVSNCVHTSCYPPAFLESLEKIKKYLNANICSLVILSVNLPPNVMILIINLYDLKCEEWVTFAENFIIFQQVFLLMYPYFVKVKLDNFHV